MSTERDGARQETARDAADESFRPIHASIKRIEELEAKRQFMWDLMAKTNAELNADVTTEIGKLRASTNAAQKKNRDGKKAMQTIIDDLRAQLAAGPAGLTEEQVNAALASMEEVVTDLDTDPEDTTGTGTGGPPVQEIP